MIIFILVVTLSIIYNSIQHGSLLALIRLVGMGLSIWLANIYFLPLADKLSLFIPYPGLTLETQYAYFPEVSLYAMDTVFFRLVAYLMIVVLVFMVIEIVAYLVKGLRFIPLPRVTNFVVGLFSGIARSWVIFFFIFTFLSLLAIDPVQNYLANSSIADFFMLRTPYLSEHLFDQLFMGIGSI